MSDQDLFDYAKISADEFAQTHMTTIKKLAKTGDLEMIYGIREMPSEIKEIEEFIQDTLLDSALDHFARDPRLDGLEDTDALMQLFGRTFFNRVRELLVIQSTLN